MKNIEESKTMEINRKNAMQLWEVKYGKSEDANDFAGRTMKKGAYDQRGSKYCWNIDHILPKSRGGKNNEDNLICTHILTNSEKSDKFPSFVANGKTFEIRKVDGKWKIVEVTHYQKDRIEAIAFWDTIYGETVEATEDFSGRLIRRKNFAKDDSDSGWSLDKFIGNKELKDKNVCIANVETIRERDGRTNFKANDINWSLRKTADSKSYEFLNEDILDIFNAKKIDELIKDIDIDIEDSYWCNILVIKANFGIFRTDFVKLILEMTDDYDLRYYSFEKSDCNSEDDLLVLRFKTPTKPLVQEIYNFAVLINTYVALLKDRFEINEIAIYNILHNCDENDLYSSLTDLLENKYAREENFEKVNAFSRNFFQQYAWANEGLFVDENVKLNISDKDGLSETTTCFNRKMYQCTLIYEETEEAVNKLLNN